MKGDQKALLTRLMLDYSVLIRMDLQLVMMQRHTYPDRGYAYVTKHIFCRTGTRLGSDTLFSFTYPICWNCPRLD